MIFVCDIQEKFRNAIYEFDKVVLTAQKVLRAAHALQIPIYATTQNRARLGDTVAELAPFLSPPLCRAHDDKTLFSMLTPAITAHLAQDHQQQQQQEPAEIVLLGIESHICVTQTALDARRAGHAVYVLADGVSSCNREEVPLALARLRAEGGVGNGGNGEGKGKGGSITVTTSEAWLYECVGDAGLPDFKAVIGIVKDTAADTTAALRALAPAPVPGAAKM